MLSKTDQYFLTIAKTRSLSQAAEQLYVSQSSLTKYIQRLEARLGAPLFNRSVSPMQLNECGKLYLQYLQDSIEKEERLLLEIGEINQDIRGTLRLGIPSFCGQCFLPSVLPVFSKEYPAISLELYEKTGYKIERALLDQSIDLGILHSPVINEGLAQQTIARERILLVAQRSQAEEELPRPWHLAVQEGHLSDILGKPVIMPQPDQKLGRIVVDFFSRLDYRPPVYTHTESVVTTLQLAAAGVGIGFTPESGLNTVSESILRQLSFYAFPNTLSEWRIIQVVRQGYQLPSFAKRFVELFTQSAQR